MEGYLFSFWSCDLWFVWLYCKLNLHPVDSIWLRRKWRKREKNFEPFSHFHFWFLEGGITELDNTK